MSQPSEPPVAVPQPSRPHYDEGGHIRSKRASMMSRAPRNNFLLATIIFGALSWLIVLVSQALVAATISNATVRIVWFGFVIQTMLLILVIEIFLCDMTIAYGLQIAVFAALSTVFAVIGVDQNIYLAFPATKAVGAGWLLTAIVNLIWIIYFTSPPESPFLRVADAVNAPTASRPPTILHTVEKIGRSQDAFLMSPAGANANANGSTTLGVGAAPYNTDPERTTMASKGDRVHTATRDTILSASAARSERSANVQDQSMALSDGATSTRPDSAATPGGRDTMVQPISPLPETPPQSWKAQALFDYRGSEDDPNELAFKKHEILTITDKSGKWWEATTADGRKGIAPSNYLKLV